MEKSRDEGQRQSRSHRFVIVIPAYNEERVVVARPVADLTPQLREGDELWVLADRCTDDTAEVAQAAGARVDRTLRAGPTEKAPALAWFVAKRPLVSDEALVVIDADNRVPGKLLDRFGAELTDGHSVLQAYLDVANPDESALATASALSYWASNRMVQLARANLGWTADLGGTGMCLTSRGAERTRADSGHRWSRTRTSEFAAFSPDTRSVGCTTFESPMRNLPRPPSLYANGHAGQVDVVRSLAVGWRRLSAERQPASLDLALASGATFADGDGVAQRRAGRGLGSRRVLCLPWPLWTAVALVQLLAPIPFLIRDRVPSRYLRKYPLLALLPLLKIPGTLRRNREWYHTPHGLSDGYPTGP